MNDPYKKPSGFQNRKRKKQRELEERLNGGDPSVNEFIAIGAAPLDDPLLALAWVRKAQLVAMQLMIRDPSLSAAEKFRAVKEMGDSIGKTHPRASIEEQFKKYRDLREKYRASESTVSTDGIIRPSTARQYSERAGGSAVSGSVSGSAQGVDEGDSSVGGGPLGPTGTKVH